MQASAQPARPRARWSFSISGSAQAMRGRLRSSIRDLSCRLTGLKTRRSPVVRPICRERSHERNTTSGSIPGANFPSPKKLRRTISILVSKETRCSPILVSSFRPVTSQRKKTVDSFQYTRTAGIFLQELRRGHKSLIFMIFLYFIGQFRQARELLTALLHSPGGGPDQAGFPTLKNFNKRSQ
jgi:hypothetical protein